MNDQNNPTPPKGEKINQERQVPKSSRNPSGGEGKPGVPVQSDNDTGQTAQKSRTDDGRNRPKDAK